MHTVCRIPCSIPVSYTHLDVYKRQDRYQDLPSHQEFRQPGRTWCWHCLLYTSAAITEVKEGSYVILEHFCDSKEENELAADGMHLWRHLNNAYCQSAMGDVYKRQVQECHM